MAAAARMFPMPDQAHWQAISLWHSYHVAYSAAWIPQIICTGTGLLNRSTHAWQLILGLPACQPKQLLLTYLLAGLQLLLLRMYAVQSAAAHQQASQDYWQRHSTFSYVDSMKP
eukprot:GHRR01028275.1.p2 GENE.GHRR01028275.1~~GHRR01028275.1.p2  ORF type:complete len:114 (-),score=24.95 GHRR01028275.1:227-568(-)